MSGNLAQYVFGMGGTESLQSLLLESEQKSVNLLGSVSTYIISVLENVCWERL